MNGNITSVKVRMYNTGSVGDCFLLLFMKGDQISYKMMIDCGGIKTNAASVKPCVEDIRTVCNNKLDLLIVTHQHEDHISGFNLARDSFKDLVVDEVWMSWVEDKTDPIAITLKNKYGKKLKELRKEAESAMSHLKSQGIHSASVPGVKRSLSARKQSMEQTMAMIEFEEGDHGKGLAAGKQTNEDAMTFVKGKGKKMVYRRPGEVLQDLAGAEGIKFYVLGPPRDSDLKYLKIEMDEDDMYKLAAAGKLAAAQEAADHIGRSGTNLIKGESPFGEEFKMAGAELKRFQKVYNSTDCRWRQIETDWLDTGSETALALTRFINNTSLAIALEFEGSGKVILLPGDAQSGNWASWHVPELMKSLKDKGGKDTDELLANTAFYKVGHHISHNGTASKSGLDRVTSKDVIAFGPLVQDKVPVAWGGAKNFPAKPLYKVLIDKTKGRVVRTDEGWITDATAVGLREQLSADAKAELKANFKKGSCFFEYTVEA